MTSLRTFLLKNSYFKSAKLLNLPPDCDTQFSEIHVDSRQVSHGSMFVAIKGATKNSLDGHDYLLEALEKGATVLVVNNNTVVPSKITIPIILVEDSSTFLSFAAEAFYGWPSKKLTLIGITGTNGKTSTSCILSHVLAAGQRKVRVMGTLGTGFSNNLHSSSFTTLPPLKLSKVLNDYVTEGVEVVIMEVSSHALTLNRVKALNFHITALTNITPEHLDFHKTMESYKNAKFKLFSDLCSTESPKFLPKNVFSNTNKLKNIHYYGEKDTPFSIASARFTPNGTSLSLNLNGTLVKAITPLIGHFQAINCLLAASIAHQMGVFADTIAHALNSLPPIKGRMQKITEANKKLGIHIFIDFAHTPDALEKSLSSLKAHYIGKIILVFGCGGDRDSSKRKIMGAIANEHADMVIVTDDNPRTEIPSSIRKEVLYSIDPAKSLDIGCRRAAIKAAIKMANKDDLVIIAGKGHENYQIYGDKKHDFCDYSVVMELLEQE